MKYHIRKIKTKSKKTAIQVFATIDGKRKILKHLGSGLTVGEIQKLEDKAKTWVEFEQGKTGLFPVNTDNYFNTYEFLGISYSFAYEFLNNLLIKFNFAKHLSPLFKDLIIARILEPNSKKESLIFLNEFLNIFHSEDVMYKAISKYNDNLKKELEKEAVALAKNELNFDFSFVLYDVTTLYFESFKDYEFQKPGFSKDGKSNQPQVVIGLIVSNDGFPLSYDIWKGNTFEGNTFIPILKKFKELHNIKTLTVVADSAMLSKINLEDLKKEQLNYIVGARLGNLTEKLTREILTSIKKEDGCSIRIEDLIVDYSNKRYHKDFKELEKQKTKALKYVGDTSIRTPKLKYLKTESIAATLNQNLIDKHTFLLGLKGYKTNLKLENTEIIKYYHNLFKVEHAWRIAKSDLESRPIYHRKKESIQNHILICFTALAITIYLEIKTRLSTGQIVKILKSAIDGKILNKVTGEILIDKSKRRVAEIFGKMH